MSNLKVVIIEDSPADAELAVATVQRTWPQVEWQRVETEAEFIAELKRQPDIIIADYEVPGFGAVAALQILTAGNCDIPLIVFTGAVTEEIVVRCMRLGAADYLLKDRLTRLGAAIENALTARSERAAKRRTEQAQQHLAAVNGALLDSIPAHAALLDRRGVIIATNAAWRCNDGHSGFSNPHWGVGADFPVACLTLRAQHPGIAAELARGVRAVLAGTRNEFASEYATGNGGQRRWFRVTVTPVSRSHHDVQHDAGAVIMHVDITALRDVEQRIDYLSRHDSLTGLPNRAALEAQLLASIAGGYRRGQNAAVLLIELDRFKTINDTLGHRTGDALIRAVTERLDRIRHPVDFLARIGGDEFVLLHQQALLADGVLSYAETIRSALEKPFVISARELFITASIGISCYPDDGQDHESLLRAADAAVYQAKQSGRNTVALYSATEDAAASERFTLQNSLPLALSKHQFALEYQPVVDLNNGAVTGVEALLRWHHPQLGLISPAHFIGIAEETGLILPISDWVLNTACAQMQHWSAAGWPEARVAVNLSSREFTRPDLPQRILDALQEHRLRPAQLRLELTESMVMGDPSSAALMINQLSEMGVEVALDDFGTGYSSLSYLKRFKLGCLKVDRSFVSGTATSGGDQSIVRAVIALGRTLDMKIVGEGVETIEQADFLRDEGCHDAQGYFYARPVQPERIPALVQEIPQRFRDNSHQWHQLHLIGNRN